MAHFKSIASLSMWSQGNPSTRARHHAGQHQSSPSQLTSVRRVPDVHQAAASAVASQDRSYKQREVQTHAVPEQSTTAVDNSISTPSVTATGTSSNATPSFDIQERIEFLRNDLTHLFDDQGVDVSAYDNVVEFKDPITNYSSLQGYLFNIQMLKKVFSPKFELHDIKAVGSWAVVTRWTMTMDFIPAKFLPTAGLWSPQLIFTGTSTYCFNPANGLINKHIDTWDSINNQAFFSLEAFGDFWRQLLATYSTPKLETPDYTVLRRAADYQVRSYPPYLVAETSMDVARTSSSSSDGQFNPAAAGNLAFGTLARFIFGGNDRKEKMEMTTPVFTNTAGRMQFVIGPSAHKDVSTVPGPASGAPVTARMEPGGVFAVRLFNGIANEQNTQKEADALIASLSRDGIVYKQGQPWILARYNDPGTLPPFRRNEVLIALQEPYELWRAGELEQVSAAVGSSQQ